MTKYYELIWEDISDKSLHSEILKSSKLQWRIQYLVKLGGINIWKVELIPEGV